MIARTALKTANKAMSKITDHEKVCAERYEVIATQLEAIPHIQDTLSPLREIHPDDLRTILGTLSDLAGSFRIIAKAANFFKKSAIITAALGGGAWLGKYLFLMTGK